MMVEQIKEAFGKILSRAIREGAESTEHAHVIETVNSLFGNRPVTYLLADVNTISQALDAAEPPMMIYADNLIASLSAAAAIAVTVDIPTDDVMSALRRTLKLLRMAVINTYGLADEYREFYSDIKDSDDITGLIFYLAAETLEDILVDLAIAKNDD